MLMLYFRLFYLDRIDSGKRNWFDPYVNFSGPQWLPSWESTDRVDEAGLITDPLTRFRIVFRKIDS